MKESKKINKKLDLMKELKNKKKTVEGKSDNDVNCS